MKMLPVGLVLALSPIFASSEEILIPFDTLDAWRAPQGEWQIVRDVVLDRKNPQVLRAEPGRGVAINGPAGRTTHLFTNLEHGDVELHIEFAVPEGSNSGVYFQGRYEIQILDSWGVQNPQHSDCGGIYQRWNDDPGLREDQRGFEGRPPRLNASREPGKWQSFDVVFRAPRFDPQGNKIENATFVSVKHNGVLIHENEEISGPTRAAAFNDEGPLGALMLQGDHGPVAFRNLRMKRIAEGAE